MGKQKLIGVLVVILVIAAGAWFYLKNKPAKTEVTGNQIVTEEMQLEQDRDALSSSSSTPNQIYGAMIRLAQRKEDVARDAALKRATDENAFLRGGAAQALGFFDDNESKAALKELLNDKEVSVRRFAIQGLGAKTEGQSEQELRALLSASPDPMTEVEIYTSLYKAGSEQAKEDALGNLLRIAGAGEDEANTEAAQRLVTIAPDNNRVLDLIRKKISAAKNERLTAVGTRYLSARNDPWIRPVLKILMTHPSAIVRSAVVQSIHRVCPPDRWEILDKMMAREEDLNIQKLILEEPIYLGGAKAKSFLEKALSADLNPDVKKVGTESLSKVEAGGEGELCDQAAPAPKAAAEKSAAEKPAATEKSN
jgi:HEAT repeat protein